MDTDEKKSCSQIFSRFRLCVNELHGILYFTKGEDSSIENRALMTENQKSTHFDKTAPFLQESLWDYIKLEEFLINVQKN